MSNKGKYHVDALTQDDVPGGSCCVAETTFATLFPAYLEKYIVSIWPAVEAVLKQHQLTGKLDAIEGSMSVSTTRSTWDPFAIVKARDFIKLIARNVPVSQAQRIFEDEMTSDIIRIGVNVKNTKRFIKRRDRLIGPQGQTLKALEILTKCYVLVQGKTVAVMGPHKGCEEVRRVVEGCMKNIHPVYRLKQLLVRRELAKRDDMKGQDWSRFIPQYKSRLPTKTNSKPSPKRRRRELRILKSKLPKKVPNRFSLLCLLNVRKIWQWRAVRHSLRQKCRREVDYCEKRIEIKLKMMLLLIKIGNKKKEEKYFWKKKSLE
jgi:ribosomal RNA assembly protein